MNTAHNGEINMKITTEIKAGSALKALENVRAWYAVLNIALLCPPTCAPVGNGLYTVTVRTENELNLFFYKGAKV